MTGVTVVIPLYNKQKYVKRAVDSVISQTHQFFEIIIVNDGSTDGGPVKVAEIKDDRVRIVHQDNLGESAARNKGISEAQYELIAFLDADDQWEPEFLENCVRIAGTYPDAGMIGTAYKVFSPEGKVQYPKFKYVPAEEGIIDNYFKTALVKSPVCSSAVVIRKEVFDKIGCFAVGIHYGPDTIMWSKIALNYPVAFINKFFANIHKDVKGRVSIKYEVVDDFPLFDYVRSLGMNINDEDNFYIKEYVYYNYLLRAGRFLRSGNRKMASLFLSKAKATKLCRQNYLLGKIALYLPRLVLKYSTKIWNKINNKLYYDLFRSVL